MNGKNSSGTIDAKKVTKLYAHSQKFDYVRQGFINASHKSNCPIKLKTSKNTRKWILARNEMRWRDKRKTKMRKSQ